MSICRNRRGWHARGSQRMMTNALLVNRQILPELLRLIAFRTLPRYRLRCRLLFTRHVILNDLVESRPELIRVDIPAIAQQDGRAIVCQVAIV